MTAYNIIPVPKPRQTRSDKWNKRECVLEYRAFADECRLRIKEKDLNDTLVCFGLPMPASWSKERKEDMAGKPHQQKPDLDNLAKALFDALYEDDSSIHNIRLMKQWDWYGSITIVPWGALGKG